MATLATHMRQSVARARGEAAVRVVTGSIKVARIRTHFACAVRSEGARWLVTKLALSPDSCGRRWALARTERVRSWSRCCFDERVSLRLGRSRANIETLVGYSLAMCAHPYAAWRSRSARRRAFVLLAYFVGGYSLVLGALLLSGLIPK